MNNKIITLTYRMYPETKGYSVKCLDWHCIYTQGDTINECKKHAIEATKLRLPDLKNGTLHKSDYPEIKPHKKSKNTFSLTFDIQKNTEIKIVPVVKTERERIRKSIEKGLIELKEMKSGKRKLRTLDELLNEQTQKQISITSKNKLINKPQRILTIDKCADCKFCIHDDFSVKERWGKYWCNMLDIQLKRADIILAKCPLPIKKIKIPTNEH